MVQPTLWANFALPSGINSEHVAVYPSDRYLAIPNLLANLLRLSFRKGQAVEAAVAVFTRAHGVLQPHALVACRGNEV